MEYITELINKSTDLIASGGLLVGFLLVLLEAFLPMLPLGVFVSLNINAFGFLPGVTISWIANVIGSYIAYLFFCFISNKFLYKFLKNKTIEKIDKKLHEFNKIPFTHLVLILTLPFTPSCFVNLLAGISDVSKQKYLFSLIIGKAFMITFWGYIGKSLIESITDIKAIVFILIILGLAYLISKIVSKKMDIE